MVRYGQQTEEEKAVEEAEKAVEEAKAKLEEAEEELKTAEAKLEAAKIADIEANLKELKEKEEALTEEEIKEVQDKINSLKDTEKKEELQGQLDTLLKEIAEEIAEEKFLKAMNKVLNKSFTEGHTASMNERKIDVKFNVNSENSISSIFAFVKDIYEEIMEIDTIDENTSVEIIIGDTTIEFNNDPEKNETSIIKLAGVALGVKDLESDNLIENVYQAAQNFITETDTSKYKVDNFILKIGDLEIKDLSASFGKINN